MAVDSPVAVPASIPEDRLEPNAIGVAQDTDDRDGHGRARRFGRAILASLAAATAYASGPALILMALPMIVIANCYLCLVMGGTPTAARRSSGSDG